MLSDNPSGTNGIATHTNGVSNTYQYSNQYLGQPRPLRVILIGAGLSGIAAVKLFKERFAGKPTELVIYEKNEDVTGTWLENRYPGCDVPAHAYSYSWEGNPRWSKAYVGSEELYYHFKGRATAYGIDEFIHLQHRVTNAIWNPDEGYWTVTVDDLLNRRTFTDQAEVIINACGFLNNWKWPNIEDLTSFRGHLVHSARWDDSYSFEDKNVAIIGSGSSAIQIVPKLQPIVRSMVSVNRSSTWITPEFAAAFAPKGRDMAFTEEQKAMWEADHLTYTEYRREIESAMNGFDLYYQHSEAQKEAFNSARDSMKERLKTKPELAATLIPGFAIGCRRLTPGYGYLEALCAENVTVKTDAILKAVPEGLMMIDGTIIEVDAIICATGFDTSFRPPFPVIGEGGFDLRDTWKDEPRSYLSVAAAGFPNYFMASGPNFPLSNGTLIPCLEKCVSYALDAIEKIQTEGIKSLAPSVEAVNDFQEHKDAIMKDMAWATGCRSWYKNGKVDGKVWGPWCGSALHFLELMSHPRWEDWNIEHLTRNRFQYLGSGKTGIEVNGGDRAWYIKMPERT